MVLKLLSQSSLPAALTWRLRISRIDASDLKVENTDNSKTSAVEMNGDIFA
jgi:hypothetical protein